MGRITGIMEGRTDALGYFERAFELAWGLFVLWAALFLFRLLLWDTCVKFIEKIYRRIGGEDVSSEGKEG